MRRIAPRRVVVTGVGAVSPFGDGTSTLFTAIIRGQSALSAISRFDSVPFGVTLGGQVPSSAGDVVAMRRAAIDEALSCAAQAGRSTPDVDLYVVGRDIEPTRDNENRRGRQATDAAKMTGITGIHSACASSADAIAVAARAVAAGWAEVALAGGADCPLTPALVAGFARLRVLSPSGDPDAAVRPFQQDRTGMVLGEGAAFLVLESWENAERSGREPLALLDGWGSSMDAYGIVEPEPRGAGAALAMLRALNRASLAPPAVSALVAHGTGTWRNDLSESCAIRSIFSSPELPPVVAPKALIGHALAAAGALSAVVAVEIIRTGVIPASQRAFRPDPQCGIAAHSARRCQGPVLTVACAFGGLNSALVFSPPGDLDCKSPRQSIDTR